MVDNSGYGINHLQGHARQQTREQGEDDTTHLDQTVCRFTIPDVGNGEGFAFGYSVGDLGGADLDSEEGNGMFLFAIWVDIVCVRVVL